MNYHFIGIGGIGMSSLAKLLLLSKKNVKGSDLKLSLILEDLKKLGARIYLSQDKSNIKKDKEQIRKTRITKPVKVGAMIIENLLNLRINLSASREIH